MLQDCVSEPISSIRLVVSVGRADGVYVEALAISIEDLELGPVVSAWGAQSVQDILPSLSGAGCHVAIRGSRPGSVLLFLGSQLLAADPNTLLERLPGGEEVIVVEADTLVSRLPNQPKLAVVSAGQVIGWLGAETENGGWPPHVHFQLSWERPETHDMPGAVDPADRAAALKRYPDPRLVLGPLW